MQFLGFVCHPSLGHISETEGLIGRLTRPEGIFSEAVISVACVFPLLTGETWLGDGQGGMGCFLLSSLI